MEERQRDLRGAHQIQVVLPGHVELSLVGRKEAGAVHGFLPHQDGRDHRGEAAGRDHVQRIPDQRPLQPHGGPEQVGEP